MNWASEHLADITCSDVAVNGQDLFRVEMTPLEKVRFYGLRPAPELAVPPGETARLTLTLATVEAANIAPAFLVLREWDHKGTFIYQVQKPAQLAEKPKTFAIHLTVRDHDRLVQAALLFEREDDRPAGTMFLVGNVSLSVV
jgi:hypothetical protein